ncbi:hypothetical protein GOP47_0000329 [Adiantum capillus-veneris]|uniref:Uncharacterized protein n=1 Tax=Adiantum capillus-veneris TaxID=13818 RepID=A0A9D4ZSZ5_ADICA|nr:hypothetical protein GOP47_0000329 [Adiantum capillus-veneris]
MSEVASGQRPPVPLTPQHVSFGENDERSTATSVRRPRNREVTSRYKSSTTQVVLNRRYPNAPGDRLSYASDLSSPKGCQSSEKGYQSPLRSTQTKVSNSLCEVTLKSSSDVSLAPRRQNGRTELLWPPSARTFSTSVHYESYLQPLNASNKKNVYGGKDNSSVIDQALKPTLNTGQSRFPEPKSIPSLLQSSDQAENAEPLENAFKPDAYRWPGSNTKMSGATLSKSVDLSFDRGRQTKATTVLAQAKPIYGSSRAPRPLSSSRALSYSVNEGQGFAAEAQRSRVESRGRRDVPCAVFGNKSSSTRDSAEKQNIACINDSQELAREAEVDLSSICCDTSSANSLVSDADSSMHSKADSLCDDGTMSSIEVRTSRGTTVPARFWQDAENRSVRASQKSIVRSSMLESDLAVANNQRPVAPQQPASLTRTSSYIRRTPSPGRSRAPALSMPVQGPKPNSAAVMLTFGGDILKRGKKGLMQVDEAHLHRILHNRLLQWRFVNAKAEAAMDAQSLVAQKCLYNTCAKTFELRTSTTVKRIQLGQGRQADKLNALVLAQAPALQAWSDLQQAHCLALKGTVQALESATIRVPVTGAVKADTFAVKEALHSASDVMNSVENSVNYLAPKAEDTYLLMSELAHVVAQERNLLEECADLVAMASALEMEECSLRAHIVQTERQRRAFAGLSRATGIEVRRTWSIERLTGGGGILTRAAARLVEHRRPSWADWWVWWRPVSLNFPVQKLVQVHLAQCIGHQYMGVTVVRPLETKEVFGPCWWITEEGKKAKAKGMDYQRSECCEAIGNRGGVLDIADGSPGEGSNSQGHGLPRFTGVFMYTSSTVSFVVQGYIHCTSIL